MTASGGGCCAGESEQKGSCAEIIAEKPKEEKAPKATPEIVDYRLTMLIAAGAAMAANCEMCLNKVVPDLIEAGVAEADIRKAVEIGQFVKDKPAQLMKEAADMLTGTNMAKGTPSEEGCPADKMNQATAVG